MKKSLFSLMFIICFLSHKSQTNNYAKCISRSADIPLSKIQNHLKLKKDVKILKKLHQNSKDNAEVWENIKDVCYNSYGDQIDFKESELEKRFYKSIGATSLYDPKDLKIILPSIIKQYVCLKKNYGLRYDIEPEFLTEAEYYKKYPDKETNYDISSQSFMQNLMNRSYDYRLAAQKGLSKCITKKEVDW